MAKKSSSHKSAPSTVENRVYLFKDLVGAFLIDHGELLASPSPTDRSRALRALADLAYASCVVADTAHLDAGEVAELVAAGAPVPVAKATPAAKPVKAKAAKRASKKPKKKG